MTATTESAYMPSKNPQTTSEATAIHAMAYQEDDRSLRTVTVHSNMLGLALLVGKKKALTNWS